MWKRRGLYDPQFEHDGCGIGAVVHVSGRRDHTIVERGEEILLNLRHRGAAGADDTTGDGAGILLQIPHEFFVEELEGQGVALPNPGCYGVGTVFLSKDERMRTIQETALADAVVYAGLRLLGWRDVPCASDCLGPIALAEEPSIRQLFVDGKGTSNEELERRLYLARRRAERLLAATQRAGGFYVTSLSCRTLVYKGLLMDRQLFAYYPDLGDERVRSALAIVHQRYSTNTFPDWHLAQPFRCIAHNGELNTVNGNRNSMRARERRMASEFFGDDIADLIPVVQANGSDSASFDNVLELLVRCGRSMPHAMMMMIPEVFGPKYHISADKRAFYEYHTAIIEPWDGPAAMLFTDGRHLGGVLDRNGLRPCRFFVTADDVAVIASETGVVDVPPDRIRAKGRLQPGRMLLVDTEEGRIISDEEIKSRVARRRPYRRWLHENRIILHGLFDTPKPADSDTSTVDRRMRGFSYTREELRRILTPMALHGQEPIGSMGNDTPLAVLSDRPTLLFDYFKQLFAQVTNPAIDPLREGLVMSLIVFAGRKRNILDETPQHCRQLKLPHPILTNDDIERLRSVRREDFAVATISALFDADVDKPGEALRRGLDTLVVDAETSIRDGASLLVLSDRDMSPSRAAIPSLLATAAVHHGLLRRALRNDAGLIVESGEPREVMHFCLLCGYGANAINPYLAFEALEALRLRGDLPVDLDPIRVIDNYIAAIKKGILKTMSRMGISTLRSYIGAQLFEAIGLARSVVDPYFTGTISRIGGIGLAEIARDVLARHAAGLEDRPAGVPQLDIGGQYRVRDSGPKHLWNATTVSRLRHAVTLDDAEAYEDYAREVNDASRALCTLRSLFEFAPSAGVPLAEVEPVDEIVKRFTTGAMSHGSISAEAHECIAVAMNGLGATSNTGEGGEDPARYAPSQDGITRSSAVKQVASGRFGVTLEYLAHARELQIKVAQGAKPGEGGQLPGHKVTEEIARLRHATPGVTLISPPPHHDIYSIEDLAQLIYDLKCGHPGAPVSVKLVAEAGVGTVAAGVTKAGADEVLISGHDGGTGASPLSSIVHTGCPWELGLAETQQVLAANGLRDRIRIQVDGQLRTGRDVVIGALLGAERFGFGTAALVTLGCTLLRHCHEGACPFGIGTQDPALRRRFAGEPEHLQRFMRWVAAEARGIMARLGFRTFDEMIGRVDRLRTVTAVDHYKARGLDLSALLLKGDPSARGGRDHTSHPRRDPLGKHMDRTLMQELRPAIERGQRTRIECTIRNTDRTVGTILSHHIVKRHGACGLPDGTVEIVLCGSAGQSFGAFLAPGMTLRLIGDSNDYLGKGLSGGRIVVSTPDGSPYRAHENIIAGNTLLYGATRGEAFINGVVGERFAVRNSGATAVVEGVGDHGCEYMTGGTVVVLGATGHNFAAGMSGGIAYVLDDRQLFDTLCNLDMVELSSVWHARDRHTLRDLIQAHVRWTGSARGRYILDAWSDMIGRFVKVVPIDYRVALDNMRAAEDRDTETTPATEEVFLPT